MLFLLVARDRPGSDAAVQRIRSTWLVNVAAMAEKGEMVVGGAMQDAGARFGSFALLNFPSRTVAERWIAEHPYTTEGVWESTRLWEAGLAPPFLDMVTVATSTR